MSEAVFAASDIPVAPGSVMRTPERRRWWRSHWFHSLLFFGLFYVLAPYDVLKSVKERVDNQQQLNEAMEKLEEGNPVRKVVIVVLGAFAMVSLLQRSSNRVRVRGPLGWAILGFMLWSMASPLWGDDPYSTLKKVFVFLLLSLAALAMARQVEGLGLLEFVIFALGSFAVAGIVSEVSLGSFRPWESGYRFAGLVHPNTMGSDCALLALAGVAAARNGGRRAWLYLAVAMAALTLLLLTKSRTALAAGLIGLTICLLYLLSRRTKVLLTVMIVSMLATVVVFGDDLGGAAKDSIVLGRTDTDASDIGSFTGRVQIWDQLWGYVQRRPLVGYGYESFWSPQRLMDVALEQKFTSPSAHSGLLELTLNLGVVGGGLFALVLFIGVIRSALEYRRRSTVEAAFIAAALTMLCVNITTESLVLQATIGSFIWMIMFARLGFIEPGTAEASGSLR